MTRVWSTEHTLVVTIFSVIQQTSSVYAQIKRNKTSQTSVKYCTGDLSEMTKAVTSYQIFCCQPINLKLNGCFNLGLHA